MANPAQSAEFRVVELDALRGIAALMVVIFHYTWRFGEQFPALPHTYWGLPWGKYGVELFFAVSGFVIFMTLEKTRTTGDFVVSRFSRLFPAYWMAMASTIAIDTLLNESQLLPPLRDEIANIPMLNGYLYMQAVDPVYWSLTVELSFYLVMLALWRIGWLKQIERVLAVWIGAKLLFWALPSLPSRLGFLIIQDNIAFFAIGILAYRVRIGARNWAQQWPLLLWALATLVIADDWEEGAVFMAVTAVFLALTRPGLLSFLCNRTTMWLGAISYPLYLLHDSIGYAMMMRMGEQGVSPIIFVGVSIAFSLGLATLVHRTIEKPSQSIIRNWWKARLAQAQPA